MAILDNPSSGHAPSAATALQSAVLDCIRSNEKGRGVGYPLIEQTVTESRRAGKHEVTSAITALIQSGAVVQVNTVPTWELARFALPPAKK